MLTLKGIKKVYDAGDTRVEALKGIDISFRKNEFVAILGPSGCGKTTLLNIIGGLDGYTDGDLVIAGRSTKDYRDHDWDTYRNHSVGFVFQNYNLIPHQTVLKNVELALTLSGVGKRERRRRAEEALKKVGLGDQLKKKPNQMSGGQMQRVAIARALVNDPEILLADEPTGALDTATSVQVMDLLQEIARDRLVIMVTHNPELAEQYANRTIRLLDGRVTDDTAPYDDKDEVYEKDPYKTKKPSMSAMTALSLSLTNLMTKKTRTLLTAFAGSIGIIGIALILALSNGVNNYIDRVQEDTLSSYPVTIQASTVDMSAMLEGMLGEIKSTREAYEPDHVYTNRVMTQMLTSMNAQVRENNLKAFRAYLLEQDLGELVSDIKYTYNVPLNIYRDTPQFGFVQSNPCKVWNNAGLMSDTSTSMMSGMSASSLFSSSMSSMDVWEEMLDNKALLDAQYDVVAGHMPERYDEAVLIVNSRHEISDFTLYALGLEDPAKLPKMMMNMIMGGGEEEGESPSFSFDEILGLKFVYIPAAYNYAEENGVWVDKSADADYMRAQSENGITIKIVGIICPSEQAVSASSTARRGGVGYLSSLTEMAVKLNNNAPVVLAQKNNAETDVLTGLRFASAPAPVKEEPAADAMPFDMTDMATLNAMLATMTDAEKAELYAKYRGGAQPEAAPATSEATYEGNMTLFGVCDMEDPSSVIIYPKNFAAKDEIVAMIDAYNAKSAEADQIRYTDYVGLLMSSVTTIINAISYILIAFVAISLVVSSIMIGIITYISVLERVKEIGILRAIGASKRDISRVFNAETLIVGFTAGAIGIIVTLLLVLIANAVLLELTSIANLAGLPVTAAVILIAISMFLTFIAGLIPAGIASRKDPVVALRSE